jgi:putative peptidoglycan lipid II flippase
MVVFAPTFVALLAPGLAGETVELAVVLLRIIAPGVGFLVMSAWCLSILNSHRRFFLSYVAPVLMNVTQVAVLVGAAMFVVEGGSASQLSASVQSSLVVWLAWGTAIGGFLQFAAQLPAVLRVLPGLRLSVGARDPGVREAVASFVPLVAGRGVVHLSNYVQLLLASFLAVGALAGLRYAQLLYVLPVSLFGMAVAAAELPELSRLGQGQGAELRTRVQAGLARIVFFVAPAVVAYVIVGDLVVAAVFQSGQFDRRDAVQVWLILGVYALGLLPTTGSRLLQSVLYSVRRARTAVRIAMLRVAVSLGLGAVFMFPFDHLVVEPDGLAWLDNLPLLEPLPETFRTASGAAGPHLGAVGLALGSTVAALLEYRLLRHAVGQFVPNVRMMSGRTQGMLLAAACSAITAGSVRLLIGDMPPLAAGSAAAGAVGVTYLVTAWRFGVPESRQIVGMITRRRDSDPQSGRPWR